LAKNPNRHLFSLALAGYGLLPASAKRNHTQTSG
jgi:hypothetical protein